jgi:hypothetical protein
MSRRAPREVSMCASDSTAAQCIATAASTAKAAPAATSATSATMEPTPVPAANRGPAPPHAVADRSKLDRPPARARPNDFRTGLARCHSRPLAASPSTAAIPSKAARRACSRNRSAKKTFSASRHASDQPLQCV